MEVKNIYQKFIQLDSKKKFLFIFIVIISLAALSFFLPNNSDISAQTTRDSTKKIEIKDLTESKSSEKSNFEAIKDSYVAKVEEKCIYVEISGAVVRPGVYCLAESDLLVNLVEKAEGFDLSKYAARYISQRLNLAQKISPNQKYYIPSETDYPSSENYIRSSTKLAESEQDQPNGEGESVENTSPEQESPTNTCININTASKEQLMTLTGVGDATATKIINARPFQKIEDIKNVSGIGDATYNKIKDLICV